MTLVQSAVKLMVQTWTGIAKENTQGVLSITLVIKYTGTVFRKTVMSKKKRTARRR